MSCGRPVGAVQTTSPRPSINHKTTGRTHCLAIHGPKLEHKRRNVLLRLVKDAQDVYKCATVSEVLAILQPLLQPLGRTQRVDQDKERCNNTPHSYPAREPKWRCRCRHFPYRGLDLLDLHIWVSLDRGREDDAPRVARTTIQPHLLSRCVASPRWSAVSKQALAVLALDVSSISPTQRALPLRTGPLSSNL